MDATLNERDLTILTCIGLLAFNVMVAVTCLIAGPSHWARRLCAITAQFSALLLLASAVWFVYCLVHIFSTTGWMPEDEFIFLPVFFPILPLLGEFLALLAIYRWRLRATTPPS